MHSCTWLSSTIAYGFIQYDVLIAGCKEPEFSRMSRADMPDLGQIDLAALRHAVGEWGFQKPEPCPSVHMNNNPLLHKLLNPTPNSRSRAPDSTSPPPVTTMPGAVVNLGNGWGWVALQRTDLVAASCNTHRVMPLSLHLPFVWQDKRAAFCRSIGVPAAA